MTRHIQRTAITESRREEPVPDPAKMCMLCRRRPRQVQVTGGGAICRRCARDRPVEMLGGVP